MDEISIIKELLEIVLENEWQYHHAAQNRYCPFCILDREFWEDQYYHHDNCKFVEVVTKVQKYLKEVENV